MTRTLEWTRTGGKTWRLTVREEPERRQSIEVSNAWQSYERAMNRAREQAWNHTICSPDSSFLQRLIGSFF